MNADKTESLIRLVLMSDAPEDEKTKRVELLLAAHKDWADRQPL